MSDDGNERDDTSRGAAREKTVRKKLFKSPKRHSKDMKTHNLTALLTVLRTSSAPITKKNCWNTFALFTFHRRHHHGISKVCSNHSIHRSTSASVLWLCHSARTVDKTEGPYRATCSCHPGNGRQGFFRDAPSARTRTTTTATISTTNSTLP